MIGNFSKKCGIPRYALFILLCLESPLFASDFWPDGGFTGIGSEINGHSRESFSFGGGLMLGNVSPYNDNENNWKNRRVEIILIKE